jgi:hypothetical protein
VNCYHRPKDHHGALCYGFEMHPKTYASPVFRRTSTVGRNSAVPWGDTRLTWSVHVNHVGSWLKDWACLVRSVAELAYQSETVCCFIIRLSVLGVASVM